MRTFTTLLAIAAFSLHVLLGCCWHHAHGATAGHNHAHDGAHVHLPSWLCTSQAVAASTQAVAASTQAEHCHHHHDEHEHGGTDGETTPHAPCSDPECVYLVVSQVTPPAAHDLVLPLSFVPLPVSCDSQIVAAFEFPGHRKIAPHVRRHLALNHFLN